MNGQELSFSRGSVLRVNVILIIVLLIDIGLLCFAAQSLLTELETRILPFFNYYPVTAARPAPVTKLSEARLREIREYKARLSERKAALLQGDFFGHYGGSCTAEPRGTGIRLIYDVESPSSLAGYSMLLKKKGLSRYGNIAFRINGATGDEVFSVMLDNNSAGKIAISRICPSRTAGAWQEIVLPLDSLGAASDDPDRHVVTILFENSQGMPYSGSLRIDDLRFTE